MQSHPLSNANAEIFSSVSRSSDSKSKCDSILKKNAGVRAFQFKIILKKNEPYKRALGLTPVFLVRKRNVCMVYVCMILSFRALLSPEIRRQ